MMGGNAIVALLLCLAMLSACTLFRLEQPVHFEVAHEVSQDASQVALQQISQEFPQETVQTDVAPNILELPSARPVHAPTESLLRPWTGEYWDMPPSVVLARLLPDIPIEYELRGLPDAKNVRSPTSKMQQVVLDHLESICEQLNWAYQYNNGVLKFVDLETRMFELATQPGRTSNTISADALRKSTSWEGNTSSLGALGEAHVVSVESDPYLTEIGAMLDLVLAKDKEIDARVNMQLLPSTNSVLVTATPNTLREIGSLLDDYNARTAQIVQVHLTLYEVSSTHNLSIGSQIVSGRRSEVASSLGIRTRVPPTTTARYGAPNVFTVDYLDPRSRFSGTSLIFEFLKSMADVEITLNDLVETRSNGVATSESTRSYQYVSSISQSVDFQGRSTVELTNDELRTGWSITVQPTTVNDLVTVRLTLSRRTLLEERPYNYGDTSGTNFVTDDFNRSMSVTLRNGETRLITSLTQQTDSKSRNSFLGLIPTRRLSDVAAIESVMLMRVELI